MCTTPIHILLDQRDIKTGQGSEPKQTLPQAQDERHLPLYLAAQFLDLGFRGAKHLELAEGRPDHVC